MDTGWSIFTLKLLVSWQNKIDRLDSLCPIFDAKAPFDDINLSSRGAFFVCLCGSKVGQELSGKVLCSLLQLNHQENLS